MKEFIKGLKNPSLVALVMIQKALEVNMWDVTIVLPTYNGGRYLKELLDSLLEQTFQSWKCLIRDDGSEDNTLEIINEYIARYPSKFELLPDSGRHLGVLGSFNSLLTEALRRPAELIALCDQDDVWLPEKLEIQVSLINEILDRPALGYTDLKLVNENLEVLAPSFWRSQGIIPEYGRDYRRVLLQNTATGCTVIVNRKLLEIALPIPGEAVMHDWWLLLVASFFGEVAFSRKATILYRQHSGNTWGVPKWTLGEAFSRLRTSKERLLGAIKQAEAFLKRYRDIIAEPEKRQILEGFVSLPEMNPVARRLFLLRNKLFKHGLLRNLGMFILV